MINDLSKVYTETVSGHYETDEIVFFWRGPFSNWHPCEIVLLDDGDGIDLRFTSSEQMFMWAKATHFNDYECADKIIRTNNPQEQKALGRQVIGYDDSIWSDVRVRMMYMVNVQKFIQNPDLAKVLMATGDKTLVEASPYDKIWGIGMGIHSYPAILDSTKWRGTNLLGEVLMQVRGKLRIEEMYK